MKQNRLSSFATFLVQLYPFATLIDSSILFPRGQARSAEERTPEKIRFADSSGLSRCEIEASRGKRPKKRPGRITGPTRRRATLTMVVHFFVTDT